MVHTETSPDVQAKWTFVFSIVLALTALSALVYCFTVRFKQIQSWKRLPLVRWLIIAIYADSYLFVVSSSILQFGFGMNGMVHSCDAAILLCLVCYLSSKLIYFFLVEKVYIIRGRRNDRIRDKLYLFNAIGMLMPYIAVICLTFVYRISFLKENGACYIGLQLVANIPLLAFDATINIYLTTLFLVPLMNLYSFKKPNTSTRKLRNVARRTFIGSLGTLLTTVANLTVLIIMRGKEPGWLCYACCNGDILVSAVLLHWVTKRDSEDDGHYFPSLSEARYNKRDTICTAGRSIRSTHGNFHLESCQGDVTTSIVAGKDVDDRTISGIPLDRIACTTETVQESRDVESIGSDTHIAFYPLTKPQ